MSPAIGKLRVAVFEEEIGPELRDVVRLLDRAGYWAVHAEEPERWRVDLEVAHCGLVMAYRLTRDLLPSPCANGPVPSIVLVSPLDPEDAIDDLRDPRVVHAVLGPGVPAALLLNAVTRAVISDLIPRLDDAIQRDPDLAALLRAALQDFLKGRLRRVKSVARSLALTGRALEISWVAAFGKDSPRLKDFCRGIQVLRAIAEKARDPSPAWREVRETLDIPRNTFHDLIVRYADRLPSELQLWVDPGVTIARVLARAVPPQLAARVVGAEQI